MKMLLLLPAFAGAVLFGASKITTTPSTQTNVAAVADAKASVYKVNTTTSNVTWAGSKLGGKHTGTVKLSAGELKMDKGNITAGSFDLDMTTIEVTDLAAGKGKESLEGHLKAGDFFEVEKFPKGKFVITKVEPVTGQAGITHNITGNLTLRDKTNPVTFGATVAADKKTVTASTTTFKINRTTWGITFHSGISGVVKDKLIYDDIELTIKLNAAK
jgi:polyisoprenoid-binding protein YceI